MARRALYTGRRAVLLSQVPDTAAAGADEPAEQGASGGAGQAAAHAAGGENHAHVLQDAGRPAGA
ncbi:hypothetical protein SDC9_134820 [bioreactor metagenome]|uniref:Uncharacterized protein n=1 Tax=bioreactor metagenome TaxID=1076179 RepID=A0A645DE15_9ZZZZ